MYEVAELFVQAYGKCSTVEKGVSGFLCTGIFPFNADIMNFAPASVSELDLEAAPVVSAVESMSHASSEDRVGKFLPKVV